VPNSDSEMHDVNAILDPYIKDQVEKSISIRNQNFEAQQKFLIANEISSQLEKWERSYSAQQEITIRNKVDEEHQKIERERKSRFQSFLTVGGVSLLAVGTLLFSNIQNVAERAAQDAVQEAVLSVNAAKRRLDEAAKEFAALQDSITNSSGAVDDLRVETRELLKEVDRSLGEIRAAEGGIALADNLSEIYRELHQIRTVRGVQTSNGSGNRQPPADQTIDEFLNR